VSNGLAQGDQLVVSDLSTPVSGMALRTSDAATGDSVPPVQQPEQSP